MQDSNFRNQQRGGRAQNKPKGNFGQQSGENSVQTWRSNNAFSNEWIVNGADQRMVEFTESAGNFMAKNGLTNSKIRSVYGEVKRIQMGSYATEKNAFLLLRPKVAYALGRERGNKGLELFKFIFDDAAKLVNDQKSFNNFANLFEAILAYHKAFGGKD